LHRLLLNWLVLKWRLNSRLLHLLLNPVLLKPLHYFFNGRWTNLRLHQPIN
jgi:hypothetical protein